MKRKLLAFLLAAAMLLAIVPIPTAAAAGHKLIAFTFDDGPSRYTSQLLDGLESRGVTATFFMNGLNGGGGIVNYKSLLTRMRDDGDQLANHTYSHAAFGKLSGSQVASEVSGVESLLTTAMGGSYIDCVRTPGGALSGTIRSNVPAPIILWSVDTLDWKYRNEDTVYNHIISQAGDGAIVLMHDMYLTSVKGALRAVDTLKSQGYEFVTVAELFRRRGVDLSAGSVYYSAPNQGTDLPAYTPPDVRSVQYPGSDQVTVTFSQASGVPLYYTTDGSTPTLGSAKYTGTLSIQPTTTFTVAGIDAYGTRTPVTRRTVNGYVVSAPTASYDGNLLQLSSTTADANIYYTTDGSDPSTSGILYSGPFSPGTTTRCIATKQGGTNSPVRTFTRTAYGALFSDVPAESWFYSDVGEIVNQGLMQGMGNYTFAPNTATTRAMIVTVLYRMAGSPAVTGGSAFGDVPAGTWYSDAITWAANNGIVNGMGDGTFAPNAALTRQQMAAIFYRYATTLDVVLSEGDSLLARPDAGSIAEYARSSVSWCLNEGLLKGMEDGSIQPNGNATRAQCAAVLLRMRAFLARWNLA